MKKLIISILTLASVVFSAGAQDKAAPRTEYSVSLSENAIQVNPGESHEITVSIVRSKSFSKAEAKLALSPGLPEGVTVSFSPAGGLFETSVATVSVAPTVKPGDYQLILKSNLNNKIKGSIVKLSVSGTTTQKDAVTAN